MKTITPKRRQKLLRQKTCRLCKNNIFQLDFKDVELLKRFQTEGGRILPRTITGNCSKHQKLLANAIKRARIMALVL